jgi:hypothetical protein
MLALHDESASVQEFFVALLQMAPPRAAYLLAIFVFHAQVFEA